MQIPIYAMQFSILVVQSCLELGLLGLNEKYIWVSSAYR